MRVSVEIPEKKGLEAELAAQFAAIQKMLMGLMETQQEATHASMSKMAEQQCALVSAMEKMIEKMGHAKPEKSDGVAEAIGSIKREITKLPDSLKSALERSYSHAEKKMSMMRMESKPRVQMSMPSGLMSKLDSLEAAVRESSHKSRNRTFGSNY